MQEAIDEAVERAARQGALSGHRSRVVTAFTEVVPGRRDLAAVADPGRPPEEAA